MQKRKPVSSSKGVEDSKTHPSTKIRNQVPPIAISSRTKHKAVKQSDQNMEEYPHSLRAVVGIGASAGGLEALSLLLKHLPKKTGMAFVYIQHLDPKHESMLVTILSRISPIPVVEATQGTRVLKDTLYVIPPNKSMRIEKARLQLAPRVKGSLGLLPVDDFFRSLAEDQKDLSIGVVLSGNASDGAEGLRAIKGIGGITFAQREDSATYPSMPHAANLLGDIDHILTPADIARELGKISLHSHVAHRRTILEKDDLFNVGNDKKAFSEILTILSAKHGVNFSLYKPMTLKRRILRRMVLNKIETLSQYADMLRKDPSEVENLYQDVLINVTEFFRDPEVFRYLKKKIFPRLVLNGKKDEHVRMWVAGSSTGEEVYSLAMAFTEYLLDNKLNIPIQIFGTDLSDNNIDNARRGVYPKSIESNVSPERLQRFFVGVDGNYVVSKRIRDMCTFAKQNIMSDPPFSKMDLVSCRNVLIYLDAVAQKRILPMFHFALRPTGFLILGKSEGVGQFSDLFIAKDKTLKVFSKKQKSYLPHFDAYVVTKNTTAHGIHTVEPKVPVYVTKEQINHEIDRALLSSSSTPACVVVDAEMNILQFRGDVSHFLQFPSGRATWNLLKIAKDDIVNELQKATTLVKRKNYTVIAKDVNSAEREDGGVVDIEVIPLKKNATNGEHLLVIFHEQRLPAHVKAESEEVGGNKNDSPRMKEADTEVRRLHKKLEVAQDQLRDMRESQESANEEFQSANEEVLSSNEELQSINEEMETTKEELQSTNEELITVNDELQLRNVELNVTNSDLINVLSSSRVPIIIVDSNLNIRRVTPITTKSIRISQFDIGRSIADIRLPIKFPNLKKSINEVIETMKPHNEDVVDENNNWYTLWIRPYRTTDNRIDGAIITLFDINDIKQSQMEKDQSLLFIQGILRTMREPLVVLDKKLRVRSANKAFYETFKLSPDKTEGVSLFDLGDKEWDAPHVHKMMSKVLLKKIIPRMEFESEFPRIGNVTMCVNIHQLLSKKPAEDAILLVMEDITARKFVQEKNDTFMSMASHELRTPATTIKLLAEILQKHFAKSKDKQLVEYLGKMISEVNHLAKISSDFLEVSSIKAGKLVLHEEPFMLGDLAREIVENCQLLTTTHEIKLCGAKKALVFGDRERIGRVLINLISNAIKYSPNANKVIIKLAYTKKEITVSVHDFGIGIAKKNHGKIFEHSYQISKTKAQHSSGLGLGLYISSIIVKRHGGRITVESIEGKGSTFSFALPIGGGRLRVSTLLK